MVVYWGRNDSLDVATPYNSFYTRYDTFIAAPLVDEILKLLSTLFFSMKI